MWHTASDTTGRQFAVPFEDDDPATVIDKSVYMLDTDPATVIDKPVYTIDIDHASLGKRTHVQSDTAVSIARPKAISPAACFKGDDRTYVVDSDSAHRDPPGSAFSASDASVQVAAFTYRDVGGRSLNLESNITTTITVDAHCYEFVDTAAVFPALGGILDAIVGGEDDTTRPPGVSDAYCEYKRVKLLLSF